MVVHVNCDNETHEQLVRLGSEVVEVLTEDVELKARTLASLAFVMWPSDAKGQERKPSQLALKLNKALLKPLVSKVAELPDLGTVPVLVEILDAVLYQWEEASLPAATLKKDARAIKSLLVHHKRLAERSSTQRDADVQELTVPWLQDRAEIFKTKSVKPRWRKGKPASTDDSPERSTSAGDSSAASVASPDETQDKAAATWRSLALGGSLLAITNGEHYGEDCEGASSKDEAPTAGNERQTQLAETQLAETQLDIDQEMPKDPDMLRWLKSQPMDSGCSDEKEEMRSSPTHVVVVDDSDE
ncbi:unnamed protein product, partial [Effrenium voratum]